MAWQCPPFRGFRDSFVYKIMSTADLSVLDVADHSTDAGSRIITWNDADQANQKFTAKINGSDFRLEPLEQGSEEDNMSLDYNREAGTLAIWNTNDGLNQLFNCQEIFEGTYLIRSLHNNYCLRNNGIGNQVTLEPENIEDAFQHWRLIPTK